jgi:capsular polysaccharide transport system permease protein
LKELDDKLAIRQSYSNPRVDRLKRFPGLDWDKSFEAFYRYYGKQVTVEYDPVSSISILTVHAFTAEDAQKINQMLLEMSERLVNGLNDRSRHDLVHFAEEEVKVAAEQARDASVALLDFRSKQAVFEPDKQAAIQLEGVAKLQGELISTEAELAQLKKLSPNNPQIIGLGSRAETLRSAITAEASKVTGGSGSLSVHASAFERLAVESQFADKQLGVAMATLESARSEAVRKQLYLDRLVQPNLPDDALEPRRIRSVLTVCLLGLLAWGTASLVLASVREHTE